MSWNSTAHIFHYVGGLACLLFGALSAAGVHLPGIDVNPAVAIPAGFGFLGVGMKVDGKTVASSLAVASVLALSLFGAPDGAEAANINLPLKAPTIQAMDCTQADCSGWVVGASLYGSGSNADILGSGVNGSIFAGGGLVGLDGGYQLWNGKFFAGALLSAAYDGNFSGTVPDRGRFLGMQVVQFGVGLSGIFAPNTGSVGNISIPQQIANALVSPYVEFGTAERIHGNAWVTGAGAEFDLSASWLLRLDYLHLDYSHGQVSNSPGIVTTSSATENLIKAGLLRKF